MNPDIIIPIAGMLTGVILGYPVVRAVVNLVERRTSEGTERGEVERLRDEVRELRAAIPDVADVHDRLLDVEERLDFTERLLTRGDGRGGGGAESG